MKHLSPLLTVAALLGIFVCCSEQKLEDPAGQATGSMTKADQKAVQGMWTELERFDSSYLEAYSELLSEKPDDPVELLNAWSEVVYRVTGHGGFWRDTVPNKYFGCKVMDHKKICRELGRLEASFRKWDTLQNDIQSLETPRQARRFLRLHKDEMHDYLHRYVPPKENLTSAMETPLFKESLAGVLED